MHTMFALPSLTARADPEISINDKIIVLYKHTHTHTHQYINNKIVTSLSLSKNVKTTKLYHYYIPKILEIPQNLHIIIVLYVS